MRKRPRLERPPQTHMRQLDWYDPQIFNPKVTIVGAGGIGSWTVLALAKLGVRQFTVYDMDTVEHHNLGSTPYQQKDVRAKKAKALGPIAKRFGFGVKYKAVLKKYKGEKLPKTDILISAVDNLETRRLLFKAAVEQKVPFFIDGRIGGENLRVYSVRPNMSADRRLYAKTVAKSIQPALLPCTAQQCIDIGFAVSGLIVKALRNWVSAEEYTPEVIAKISHLQLFSSPPKESERRRKWRADIEKQRRRIEEESHKMAGKPENSSSDTR